MQPSIPVPTDNLYKFAALFGLVLIVASIVSVVSTYNSAYDELVEIASSYIALEGKSDATTKQMKQLMDKRIEVIDSNREFYVFILSIPIVIGGALSVWGFQRWARIQPLHDELIELQVAKVRKEVYGDLAPHNLVERTTTKAKKPKANKNPG